MTALTADTPITMRNAGLRSYKVADNVKIYKGSIVCRDTSGYANIGADTSGFEVLGIAHEQVDNTLSGHTAGGKRIRVQSGAHFLLVAASLAQTSVGKIAYVTDSATVGLTSTNSVPVGMITEYISATSAWVLIPDPGLGQGAVITGQPLGYQTGSGGAVTQATNKSTGVTLNTPTGAITMNAANLAATTSVAFTLTNSCIQAGDLVIVNFKSGNTANSYQVAVDAVAAGSCSISLRNYTAGGLAEAVVLSYAVIKGAIA